MVRNLSNQRFGVQLLCFIGFWQVLGLLLISFVSIIVIYLFTHQASFDILKNIDENNVTAINIFKTILPFQTILYFGLPAILFTFFAYKNSVQYIGLRPIKNNSHLLLGIFAIITGLYFVGLLAQWNKMIPMPHSWVEMENKAAILTKVLLKMNNVGSLMLMIFIVGLLPAICEELLFRGCMQNILIQQLGKKNALVAILITAIIFGLIHEQMQTLLPRIFLGTVLGLLYYYSNSIYTSIAAHFVNNALQVVVAYFASHKNINPKYSEDMHVPLIYGLISGVICLGIILVIYKSKQEYIIYTTESLTQSEKTENQTNIQTNI